MTIAQQQRVHRRLPGQPASTLVLLPAVRANPDGPKPISPGTLDNVDRHGWPPCRRCRPATAASSTRPASRLTPIRTYAQRHADAGVAPDVLRDLMDHRVLDTTKGH